MAKLRLRLIEQHTRFMAAAILWKQPTAALEEIMQRQLTAREIDEASELLPHILKLFREQRRLAVLDLMTRVS
jgi:hypothetical protein